MKKKRQDELSAERMEGRLEQPGAPAASFPRVEFGSETPSFAGTFADDMMAETMHPSAAHASIGLCAAAFESASQPHVVHGRSGVAVAATVLKWEQLLRDHPHDPMVRSPPQFVLAPVFELVCA